MSEDLQGLLEKINREGVEKAKAAADEIVAEAKAKAAAIVKAAEESAAKAKSDAETAAAQYEERARVSLAQAARDTVLKIEGSVTAMLEKGLLAGTKAALTDGKTAAELIKSAVGDLSSGGEIACSGVLASALAAELAAKKEFTVITDETLNSGFKVKVDNGRVEHSFTGETIAAELSKRLRPDLAKLLK